MLYQEFMDDLLVNSHVKIKIKVMRERQQRWLANQRNASWVIETLRHKINEKPVLVLWAHMVGDHAASDNARLIAKDVVEMLVTPEVIIALNFEREMGLYFEVTSKWHGSPGCLATRPGFTVMEIHNL